MNKDFYGLMYHGSKPSPCAKSALVNLLNKDHYGFSLCKYLQWPWSVRSEPIACNQSDTPPILIERQISSNDFH